jgi:hypothetical protein
MGRIEYHIVVVDRWPRWQSATRKMIEAGLPPSVAVRWQKVRREMSPAGLKRKLREVRN